MRTNLETGLKLMISVSNRDSINQAFNRLDPVLMSEDLNNYIYQTREGLAGLLQLCESYLDTIEILREHNSQLKDAQVNLLLKMKIEDL